MNTAVQLAEEPASDAPSLGIESIVDLAQADFELMHPVTGVGTGLFITLAGPEHPDRKRVAMNVTRAARAALSKKMASTGQAIPDLKDPEEEVVEQIETLAAATLGWYRKDGKPCVPFSAKAVRELYSNPSQQWVVRQVRSKFFSLELFIGA